MTTTVERIAESLVSGTCNFFLGAGASAAAAQANWLTSSRYPNADQLKAFLMRGFSAKSLDGFVSSDAEALNEFEQTTLNELEQTLFGSARTTLAEVAGHMTLEKGRAELDRWLRAIFVRKQVYQENPPQPAPIHVLVANSIRAARDRTKHLTFPLILTTNYDDLMERALREAQLPFRVFSLATGHAGQPFMKELHRENVVDLAPLDQYARKPSRCHPDDLRKSVFVLKLHGEIPDDLVADTDYVISELDYMRYLLHVDPQRLFPLPMMEAYLKQANALILGYGFHDWNMRLFFSKIWEHSDNKRWAVGLGFGTYQAKLLESHFGIDLVATDLNEFVDTVGDIMKQSNGA